MKVLFAGELWPGSTGLSLVKALSAIDGLTIKSVATDLPVVSQSRWVSRAIRPLLLGQAERNVFDEVRRVRPDVFLTCKGWVLSGGLIRRIRKLGILTVNIYPDLRPLMHGERHRRAVGEYDLVISTKQAHLDLWKSMYGYQNRILFVPHGYDPATHYRAERPAAQTRDVLMCATWREAYERLVRDLAAQLASKSLRIDVVGGGWGVLQGRLPPNVRVAPPVHGDAYTELLRQSRICIAPLTPPFPLAGQLHPGDQDTTRTYELAAANCFFIHQRTPYMRTVFDDTREVPMFDDPAELADQISRFHSGVDKMEEFARAAHRRAVPAYSIPERARKIHALIARALDKGLA